MLRKTSCLLNSPVRKWVELNSSRDSSSGDDRVDHCCCRSWSLWAGLKWRLCLAGVVAGINDISC
jgi:hypothetical protein